MFVRFNIVIFAFVWVAASAAAESVRITSETASADLLSSVRAELTDEEAPQTVFEARRQAKRAAERIEAYLNSRGFFDAQTSYAVETGPPIVPRVKVEPGKRFRFGTISVTLSGSELTESEQARLQAVQTLEAGAIALPSDIVAQEAGLIAVLKSLGYGEAEAQERNVVGDRAAGTIDVEFKLAPGPRLRLGQVIFTETVRTRRDYLNRLIPFEEGDLYTPETLSEFNRRLSTSRLYSISSARIDEVGNTRPETGDDIRNVIVTLKDRPRYTVRAGTSFSGSEGLGATTRLTRHNATRRGDTLTGSVTLAEQQESFGADWRIPNFTAYDRTLNLSGVLTQEDTDAFEREAINLIGRFEVVYTPRLTLAFGAESEFTREEDSLGQRDLQVLSGSLAARLDHADDPLDPRTGWRADLRAEPALAIGDRESQFFTLNGQISAYRPAFENQLILAARARSGFIYGARIEDLPVSRRFFAGGGGSARGFAFQSVGPKDEDGSPIGGRGLMEFSGELRWQGRGNLGYVGFFDGAAVSAAEAARFGDLRYSAGFGVRYKTIVGPIRFDLAFPIDKESSDDPFQVYVSIGQAF